MYMNSRVRTFLFVACLLMVASSFASAQGGFDSDSVLVLSTSPEHPNAFTKVRAELKSFSIDLSRATVSWSLDGVVKREGQGERLFQFETKGLGVPVVLKVTATTADGRLFEKIRLFAPAGVELVWQANSYTPPFYKGKALFSYEGTGTAVAVPFFNDDDGSRIAVRDLIFTWKENNEKVVNASGVGKDLFPLLSTIPVRPITINVVVESNDQRFSAEKEITINPIAPQIVLYENHPLYGILFNHAIIDSIPLVQELSLSAMPYFFNTSKRAEPSVTYEWGMNYKQFEEESGDTLIVRRVTNEIGKALLSVRALLPTKSLQEADRNIFITSDSSFGVFDPTGNSGISE